MSLKEYEKKRNFQKTSEPPPHTRKTGNRRTRAHAGGKRRSNDTSYKSGDVFEGVALSNPDKVLYPDQGLTKADLARYYLAVADVMLPYVVDRPLTLVRCPEGQSKSASTNVTSKSVTCRGSLLFPSKRRAVSEVTLPSARSPD